MTTLVVFIEKSRDAAEWSVSAEVSGAHWCVCVCVWAENNHNFRPAGGR